MAVFDIAFNSVLRRPVRRQSAVLRRPSGKVEGRSIPNKPQCTLANFERKAFDFHPVATFVRLGEQPRRRVNSSPPSLRKFKGRFGASDAPDFGRPRSVMSPLLRRDGPRFFHFVCGQRA